MEEKNLVTLSNEVAEYIEYMKRKNYTLIGALNLAGHNSDMNKYMDVYLSISSNQEKFALAWINGYKVKEKIFLIKFKGFNNDNAYLNIYLDTKYPFMSSREEIDNVKTKFIKEELEQLGFGWVFNSEGVQIIEVKE